MPSFTSFTSSESAFFCPRIWTPFRRVPFFESRSSIVTVDRERMLRWKEPNQRPSTRLSRTTYPATLRDIVDLERNVLPGDGFVRNGQLPR
jgi:hypothetical protein